MLKSFMKMLMVGLLMGQSAIATELSDPSLVEEDPSFEQDFRNFQALRNFEAKLQEFQTVMHVMSVVEVIQEVLPVVSLMRKETLLPIYIGLFAGAMGSVGGWVLQKPIRHLKATLPTLPLAETPRGQAIEATLETMLKAQKGKMWGVPYSMVAGLILFKTIEIPLMQNSNCNKAIFLGIGCLAAIYQSVKSNQQTLRGIKKIQNLLAQEA